MIWVKGLHIVAIAFWSGALICLPGLYVQRAVVPDGPSLHRLHAMVRFLYVAIMSPSAFVAVGSGTALVFMQATFEPWFSVKLALVGVMVMAHILTGLVILRLFDEGAVYPVWRFLAATFAILSIVVLILIVVLAKPEIPDLFPPEMRRPGALRDLFERLISSPRS